MSSSVVPAAIEEQCGALRGLAMSMRATADAGLLRSKEAKLVGSWADMIDDIALQLAESLRDKDKGRLARMWKAGLVLALPFAANVTLSSIGGAWASHELYGSDVEACASNVVRNGELYADAVYAVDWSDSQSGEEAEDADEGIRWTMPIEHVGGDVPDRDLSAADLPPEGAEAPLTSDPDEDMRLQQEADEEPFNPDMGQEASDLAPMASNRNPPRRI